MECDSAKPETEMALPQPTWLLIAISLVNMALGAITATVGLMGLELVWPTSPFTAVCIGITLFGLGNTAAQYLGTFHRSRIGTDVAASGGFFAVNIFFLAWVFSDFLLAIGGPTGLPRIPLRLHFYTSIALITIVGFTIGGFNFWWAAKLKAYVKACPQKRHLSFSLRETWAFCILVAIVIAPAAYRAHTNPSLYLTNVSAADVPLPLPAEARHVDYQRNRHHISRAKFQINEAPLRQWLTAKKQGAGLRIQEIATPVDVDLPEPIETLPRATYTVPRGFRAIWNGDHVYYFLVYDRPQGTAYYFELAYLDED